MNESLGVGIFIALFLLLLVTRRRAESVALPHGAAASVEELIAAGRKIEAIKRLRAQTGLGLKEAKDAVEAIAQGTASVADFQRSRA